MTGMGTSTSRRTRPAVAAVIVVALLAAVGGWWWSQRETGPRLGDYGRVTATVEEMCMHLRISVDDLALQGVAWPLPADLRGKEVEGTLELTGRRHGSGNEGVSGVFTTDDGLEVEVSGGREGEYFFNLSCAIWPEPPPE